MRGCVKIGTPSFNLYCTNFFLFLLVSLLVGLFGSGLVALVQAVDHIVGNVEPLVGLNKRYKPAPKKADEKADEKK